MSQKRTHPTLVPTMRYADAPGAMEWLCRAFGFEQHLVVPGEGGTIRHAQLTFGNGMIMLGSARDDSVQEPPTPGRPVTQSVYVIIDDVDAHCRRAREAGAEIVVEPEDQLYRGRFYACRDPQGMLWNFGEYDPWAAVDEGV